MRVGAGGAEASGDRELVGRARDGDREAFGTLVRRHQDRIYSAVLRFCGRPEEAEEITQRAFVNAFRRLGQFLGDSAFGTWLYRIAFNEAVSLRREGARRRLVSIHGPDGEPIADAVDDRSPTEPLESEEDRRKVQEALNRLGVEDRKILVLKEIDGRSYDEIAAILEVPKGTVRSRLFRARQALKVELKAVLGQELGVPEE